MAGFIEYVRSKARSLCHAVGRKSNKEIVFALCDYEDKDEDSKSRLSCKKGDRFILKSSTENCCWHVKSKESGKSGYVPSKFLIKLRDEEHLNWISVGLNRKAAKKLLMDEKLKAGAFIIRENEGHSISHSLVLSVKMPRTPESFGIVHFLIEREGYKFRLEESWTEAVDTLDEFVKAHTEHNASDILLTFSVKKQENYQPRWEYEANAIKREDRCGDGNFGDVFRGTLNGKRVAIKQPSFFRHDRESVPKEFLREAEIVRHCTHPNVLETLGICKEMCCIIMEFVDNCRCLKYYMYYTKTKLSLNDCGSIAHKIARGMEYLAERKIIHRDLTSGNILVGRTIDTIKIADFRRAHRVDDPSGYYRARDEDSPISWTAPEAFVRYDGIKRVADGKITSAADVWSFGVVMWELYTNGMDPFENIMEDVAVTYKKLTMENYRLPRPDSCPEDIYKKMRECWDIDPKARPTFSALRSFLANACSCSLDTAQPILENDCPLDDFEPREASSHDA